MLDVYHWEPNGASGRILIALAEKRLAFNSHYIDLLALEQYAPAMLELSANGEVPVVVLDGAAYRGESQVAEWLEEQFPEAPLMPADPRGRWSVRVWQKSVDDGFAAAVSEVAWTALGVHSDGKLKQRLRVALDNIGPARSRAAWKTAVEGFSEERLSQAHARIEADVAAIEAALAGSPWLAGAAFSLADVAVFPYLRYLPRIAPHTVGEARTPRTMAWLRAVEERPAVREALARGRRRDPFALAVPGPEPVRWG